MDKARISAIAAVDGKNGMGKDNKIPWHIKEDLVRLREFTKGNVAILGRKTYESMVWYYDRSGKPMPAKLYIVITSDANYKPTRENVTIANSLQDAIKRGKGESEIFVLGGGQVFKEAIEGGFVDRIYLTVVEGDFDCDTFFPDYSSFKVVSEGKGESEGQKYTYKILEKN